jgi:putative oxidoreductase
MLTPPSPSTLEKNMTNENVGKLILRVVLGFLIILHGIHKLLGGVDWLEGMLANAGLPGFLKYGAYLGEVVGPALVIAGYYSRIGGWLIAVNMLFALGLAQSSQLFSINADNGNLALELEYLFLASAIAVALIGPGRYAVNQK